ncbi:LuxR C-terminal-related transcriptional regulator [Streptomyces tauricus]|uniref:LuxR C-terminal-related transcriptional regulator n=1 Tax=Streptomyces tauricus TaxID=68274 RepID=UPI0033B20313
MDERTERRRSPRTAVTPPQARMSHPGVPPLPRWLVPRPRLTDRLSQGVLGPLTVVVGPVGAGKSALAVEWAHTRRAPGPVAWVTCDGAEEQPNVFWPRVLTALREASVDLPSLSTPPIPAPPPPDFPTPDTHAPASRGGDVPPQGAPRDVTPPGTGRYAALGNDGTGRDVGAQGAGPYAATGRDRTAQGAGRYGAPGNDSTGRDDTPQGTGRYAATGNGVTGRDATAQGAEPYAATGNGMTGRDLTAQGAGRYAATSHGVTGREATAQGAGRHAAPGHDGTGLDDTADDAGRRGGTGLDGQRNAGPHGADAHDAVGLPGTAHSVGLHGGASRGVPSVGGVPGGESYDRTGAGGLPAEPAGPGGGSARNTGLTGVPLDGPPPTGAGGAGGATGATGATGDGIEPLGFPAVAAAAGQALLVAALAAGLVARDEPVVLVLDDFQPESGSPVAEGMARLLRHATPALRLVVVSRRDPPLHLHRYRLAGDLTELRTGDLAFDDRETAALLAQHGVEVPRAVVKTLRERADGWAAGLRLAAMSMQGHPHPERFVARFAGEDEAIVSYLVEEVLDGQTPAMRRLLLTTSVLDPLNAELATQVAGQEAGRHFAALVAQSSFLQHIGHGWYRCHRMFGDVLRVRLRHEAPDLVPDLHGRAAEWLGEHGLLAEAVRHALAADDRSYADRLVVHQLAIGQVLALTSTRLPGELLTRTPPAGPPAASGPALEPETALVTSAAALARGDGPACTESLALADRLIEELPGGGTDRIARCRLAHSVIRTTRDRPRHLTAARAAAADAERLFTRLPRGLLEDRPELVALTLSVRGRAELRDGDLKAAEASLTTALKSACAAGNGVLRRDCLSELALLEVLRGRFRAADQFAGHARHPALQATSQPDPSPAALHVVRAWIGLARFDVPRARSELSRSRAALRQVPDPFVTGVGSLVAKLVVVVESGTARPEALDTIPDIAADGWLAEGLRQSVRHACAASLGEARARRLPARAVPGPRGAPDPRPRDDRAPVESLSARERDVLRQLAQMMTTEEIADELYVSVNTVKTHLKSVYRKLAVTRRSAAVRRARELELL